MVPLTARVRKGRLVLDEPTDLPEGDIVELVPLERLLANGDDLLDDDERAALHRELDASIQEADAGSLELGVRMEALEHTEELARQCHVE
ncbi:MAG TPA: hypothetical protein VK601_09175, partial [Kofleriaceae bacterium]|nr:hypothetical protein [Kofleriaceae bacterium]